LTSGDIGSTQGYQQLKDKVEDLGLSIRLDGIEVEGDGVQTRIELDEFINDYPGFYTVTVSGRSGWFVAGIRVLEVRVLLRRIAGIRRSGFSRELYLYARIVRG